MGFSLERRGWTFDRLLGPAAGLVLAHLVATLLLRDLAWWRVAVSDVFLLATNGAATAALVYAATRAGARDRHATLRRVAWGVIALAQLVDTVGDGISAVAHIYLNQTAAPLAAHELYICAFALGAVGVLLLPGQTFSPRAWLTLLLDAGTAAFTGVLIFLVFFVLPAIASRAVNEMPWSLTAGYPISIFMLFAALLRLGFSQPLSIRTRTLLLLTIGGGVRIIAGILFFHTPMQMESFLPESVIDSIWLISYVLVGLAGVNEATDSAIPDSPPAAAGEQTIAASFLPYLWIVIAFPLLLWNRCSPLPMPGDYLAWSITSILTLVLIRQILTVNENTRLYDVAQTEIAERRRAEHALREAHADLDERVHARTAELAHANETLRAEIAQRQQAQEENLKRTAQLEALRQTSLVLSAQLDLSTLLGSMCQRAVNLIGAARSSFFLYRPDQDILERQATWGPELTPSHPFRRRGDGLIGRIWETGAPIVDNAYVPEEGAAAATDGAATHAVMGSPIYWGDRFLGAVTLMAAPPRTFSTDDVDLLKLFADQAAIALENARLYEQAQQEIRERERTQAALRESEGRYALAVRGANDGLWDWDLRTGEVFYSPRWKAMLGWQENEIGTHPDEWFDRLHPLDGEHVRSAIASHLGGQTPHFESEYRALHKDGSYRWILSRGLAVRDADGRAYRFAGSQTDISARKTTEERLLHDALHDMLTGLPNRALFMDRVTQAIKKTKRLGDCSSGILFLDLDRFKLINDSLGHLLGDKMLMEIARRIQTCLRPSDTIARFGGDEFAILVEEIKDTSDTTRIADRIQTALAAPWQLEGREMATSASIGIALATATYERAEDLVRDADTAMYRAKALGKARYEIFATDMHRNVVEQVQMEADLRMAVVRNEFRVFYQPFVSLATGTITGAEALVRWQHPRRGLVAPADFIPLAEETGLIVPVDEWVLRTACHQAQVWRSAGYPDLRIAVNTSARQLENPALPQLVFQILNETGLAPTALELEITETLAMRDMDLSVRILNALAEMGIRISIDDFGNSYSALGYLKHFPLATLKIAGTFVQDMIHNADDAAIVTAIITMAHSLKLRVVAEGVETQTQRHWLYAQACDEMQGYLSSYPLPAAEFLHLLENGRPLADN